MRQTFAVFLVFLGAWSQTALACSCRGPTLEEQYRDSDVVYLAEVISVRLVTEKPLHNAPATYEIALRQMRIFKGRDPGIQTTRYTSTYHDRSSLFPFSDVTTSVEVTNSCDTGFRLGELAVVFKKYRTPLRNANPCSAEIVQGPSRDFVGMVEKLSQ